MIVPVQQRALLQTAYGEAKHVLRMIPDRPVRYPTSSEVQVKVHAASINAVDGKALLGQMKMAVARTFPFVPLFDVAGIVTAIGPKVTRFKVGDSVHGTSDVKTSGGAQEYANLDEGQLSHKPATLSFAEAAAIPCVAKTALLAVENAGINAKSRVCILGASGGVGSFAVQFAKAAGAAEVIGVAGGPNAALVRSLGADTFVDYLTTKVTDAFEPHSLDVVLDCVGGSAQWFQAQKVLRRDGQFITIVGDVGGRVTIGALLRFMVSYLYRKILSTLALQPQYTFQLAVGDYTHLDRVDALIGAGKADVRIENRYDFNLKDAIALFEHSRSGRTTGKLVLDIIRE